MSGRRAVFLDRDGTLIEDPGYLADPAAVRLLPGAARAVARLNRAGLVVVVVTNQSGIARGLLTEAQYHVIAQRLDELLGAEGARLEGHFHCPHHPDISGACECRKPGLLLYRRAAERLGIDLPASWWVGDRTRDVRPAEALGGRGILLLTGDGGAQTELPHAPWFRVAPHLPAAVDTILTEPVPVTPRTHYFPPR